jgi:hypothetical protein
VSPESGQRTHRCLRTASAGRGWWIERVARLPNRTKFEIGRSPVLALKGC